MITKGHSSGSAFLTADRGNDEPMLFWAERDPKSLWRSTTVILVLMSPFIFFAPAGYIAMTLVALLSHALNRRFFKFQLTAHELRLRSAALMPTLHLPLRSINSAVVVQDPEGMPMPLAKGSAHLLITTTEGQQLLVPGIADANAAAEAISRLKKEENTLPELSHAA